MFKFCSSVKIPYAFRPLHVIERYVTGVSKIGMMATVFARAALQECLCCESAAKTVFQEVKNAANVLREQAAWKYREHVALKKRRKCQ